jgi:hypothetical protein
MFVKTLPLEPTVNQKNPTGSLTAYFIPIVYSEYVRNGSKRRQESRTGR